MSSDIATTEPSAGKIFASASIGNTGIEVHSGQELYALAVAISRSGMAPKGMEKPEMIVIALQMGMELGLPAMASLQNIAVINGRPSLWGDAQLAVVRATNEMEEFEEWYETAGERLPRNPVEYTDDTVAVCRVKRHGLTVAEVGFSVADAKRAKLWGKQGPWTEYPFRMLRMRARSFALRDSFGDALRGLLSAEEARDIPEDESTINATRITHVPNNDDGESVAERLKRHAQSQGFTTVAAEASAQPQASEPQSPAKKTTKKAKASAQPEPTQEEAVDPARIESDFREAINLATKPAELAALRSKMMESPITREAKSELGSLILDYEDALKQGA